MSKEWEIALAAGISTVLASCQRQALPPFIATDTGTPTNRPPATDTATAIPSLTATPDRISLDNAIKRKLFEAKEGETIILQNVTIGNIIRFPWLFGSAYLTTLAIQDIPGKQTQAAIVLSSQCIYDALKENGLLGKPSGDGTWKPQVAIDTLQLKVLSPYSLASPRPLLDAKRLEFKGRSFDCKEEHAKDQLKDFFKKHVIDRVDWNNLPKDIEERIWRFLQEFLSGFRQIVSTPTRPR